MGESLMVSDVIEQDARTRSNERRNTRIKRMTEVREHGWKPRYTLSKKTVTLI